LCVVLGSPGLFLGLPTLPRSSGFGGTRTLLRGATD